MANKYQHQLDAMTEAQRDKYRKTESLATFSGFISLFSFFILIPISMVMPQRHYGNIENLFQLAPLGLFIAVGGLIISITLRGRCRELREAASISKQPEQADKP